MKGIKKKAPTIDIEIDQTPILDDGLTLLEVTMEQVAAQPKIGHLFKGIGDVFEFLEGSEDPEARKILEARRRVTAAQAKHLPFEAYCVCAGVSTKKAFGIVSQEVFDQSSKAAAMLLRASHPAIVQATIDQAKLPLGSPDRKMLHQATAFLPMPKGNINVFGNVGIDNRQQQVNVAVLPPVEDSVKRMSDRFGEMMAPAAIEAPDIVYDQDED